RLHGELDFTRLPLANVASRRRSRRSPEAFSGQSDARESHQRHERRFETQWFQRHSFAVVASYGPDKSFNGKSIAEITKIVRKKSDVTSQIEQMLEMYEAGGAGMIYHG